MAGNAELLNFVYQNSQMGVDTISQLLKINDDAEFAQQLGKQYSEYCSFHEEAKKLLNENGYGEKDISKFDAIKVYLMINMQTLTDRTASHIAEMLITGATMGVIDAIKRQKQYCNAEQHILDLMGRLQKSEENNIEKLKEYL